LFKKREKGKSAKMSTANYLGNFFTHQMKRVPRSVDQFPAKLKFKARMTRPRFGHKTVPTPQLVVLPQVDKMEKLRYPDGTTFPRFLEKEIQGQVGMGPMRRLLAIADEVTELVRYERIEGSHINLQDTRHYAELLLQLAVANGDRHRPTMELVDFYIREKDLVPKLFKVLVPRYIGISGGGGGGGGGGGPDSPSPTSITMPTRFTDYHRLPPANMRVLRQEPYLKREMRGILELRGNPWPSVVPRRRDNSGLITNVLLKAAKDAREEAARKRAVDSVKAKVGAVKESLEAAPSGPSGGKAAAASSGVAAVGVVNPYADYFKKGKRDVAAEEVDAFEDAWEEQEQEEEEEEDYTNLELKLKNLDLKLT